MIQRFLYQIFFVLLFILSFGINSIYAQQPEQARVFEDSDTMALYNAMHQSPADAQLSEVEKQAVRDSLSKMKYAVEQFKQVFTIKKDILWSPELADKISDFYDTTFILVNSQVHVQDKGALISIVNTFGSMLENGEQDPYISVRWIMVPEESQSLPYSLAINIDHGISISSSLIDSLELRFNNTLKGITYYNTDDSKSVILAVMDSILNAVGIKYGNSLAPAFALYYNNIRLSNGHHLSFMYSETPQGSEKIYAGTLSGDPLEIDVLWINVDSADYSYAYIEKDSIQEYTIQAIAAKDTIKLTVNIITNDAQVLLLSILEELLLSVGQDMIDYYYLQYKARRLKAISVISNDTTSGTSADVISSFGDYTNVTTTEPVSFGPSEPYPLSDAEYQSLMANEEFRNMINKRSKALPSVDSVIVEMKIIAIVKEIIRPENFILVRDDITQHLDSHVSALGSLFIQAVFSGDRMRMKTLFRDYLVSRLDHFTDIINNR